MSNSNQKVSLAEPTAAQLEQATQWFLRVRSESAQVEDLPDLKDWIESDPGNRSAYRQVAGTWAALGQFSSAPEVMVGRRDALDDARRAARRRWSTRRKASRFTAIAASAAITAIGALVWTYSQRDVYTTDLGERRALTLEDGSVVTLDAKSRVRVQYDPDQRILALERGQAHFDVAKDPARPFRVRVGDQTVVALGTQFNVELVAGNVLLSMIEGRVAVTGIDTATDPSGRLARKAGLSAARPGEGASVSLPGESAGQALQKQEQKQRQERERGAAPRLPIVELKAGEGLRVRADGQAVVLPKINVDRATAWQSGKMFFDNEPLASAVERVNRYSQVQIEVDPAVADVRVSGVFNAGDSTAFVEAIATYFAVQIDRGRASKIHLTARH